MTNRFLRKKPKELFWLCWLGIPYLIWLLSIGIELNKKISRKRGVNTALFMVLVGYSLIYCILAVSLLISGKVDIASLRPFHFAAMAAVFLLIILASKTIVRFEKEHGLKQSNGFGLFFGIWYFIFGIWDIQPKLNQYIKLVD